MYSKKIKEDDNKSLRVYVSSTQHKRITDIKTNKEFNNHSQALEYVLDNQRPANHQEELDEEIEKTKRFKQEAERLSWKYNNIMSNLWTIFTNMAENDQMITVSEKTWEELHPDLKAILEQTVYMPPTESVKEKPYNHFTPTVKVPDIANEELE